MISIRFLLSVALLVAGCNAFGPFSPTAKATSSTKPSYDKTTQRWSPAPGGETASDGYDAVGSLLRQGPGAYFTRVTNADQYDQAVMQFMANEGCSYQMAQGNVDRMNENMQDWQFERMEAEKAGRKIDYVTIDTKQVALTAIWGSGISFLIGRGLYVAVTGERFNDIFQ